MLHKVTSIKQFTIYAQTKPSSLYNDARSRKHSSTLKSNYFPSRESVERESIARKGKSEQKRKTFSSTFHSKLITLTDYERSASILSEQNSFKYYFMVIYQLANVKSAFPIHHE